MIVPRRMKNNPKFCRPQTGTVLITALVPKSGAAYVPYMHNVGTSNINYLLRTTKAPYNSVLVMSITVRKACQFKILFLMHVKLLHISPSRFHPLLRCRLDFGLDYSTALLLSIAFSVEKPKIKTENLHRIPFPPTS